MGAAGEIFLKKHIFHLKISKKFKVYYDTNKIAL